MATLSSINYILNSRKKQLQQACCYKIYMSRTTKCLSKKTWEFSEELDIVFVMN